LFGFEVRDSVLRVILDEGGPMMGMQSAPERLVPSRIVLEFGVTRPPVG
jgi:hypothetical protein